MHTLCGAAPWRERARVVCAWGWTLVGRAGTAAALPRPGSLSSTTPPPPPSRRPAPAPLSAAASLQAGVITTVFVAADWSTVERLAGKPLWFGVQRKAARHARREPEGGVARYTATAPCFGRLPRRPGSALRNRFCTLLAAAGDHPAQSRAAPPLRVPDITADEALHYLEALGVEGKLAGKAGPSSGCSAHCCMA